MMESLKTKSVVEAEEADQTRCEEHLPLLPQSQDVDATSNAPRPREDKHQDEGHVPRVSAPRELDGVASPSRRREQKNELAAGSAAYDEGLCSTSEMGGARAAVSPGKSSWPGVVFAVSVVLVVFAGLRYSCVARSLQPSSITVFRNLRGTIPPAAREDRNYLVHRRALLEDGGTKAPARSLEVDAGRDKVDSTEAASSPVLVSNPPTLNDGIVQQENVDFVLGMMRHVWSGYRTAAWGHDDVKPVSGEASDWIGYAVQVIEALDTLYLMGLQPEFTEGLFLLTNATTVAGSRKLSLPNIRSDRTSAAFHQRNTTFILGENAADRPPMCTFEIVIRALGGLLGTADLLRIDPRGWADGISPTSSAADEEGMLANIAIQSVVPALETTARSGKGILKTPTPTAVTHLASLAREVGVDLLDYAFPNVGENRIPFPHPALQLDTHATENWGNTHFLAEVGSIQLEFRALANQQAAPELCAKPDQVLAGILRNAYRGRTENQLPAVMDGRASQYGSTTGLLGSKIVEKYHREDNSLTLSFSGRVSLSARSDSFYEYLLKLWLLGGKRETNLLSSFAQSVRDARHLLIRESADGTAAFLGSYEDGNFQARMDHLSCFFPGTLLLAAHEASTSEAAKTAVAPDEIRTWRELARKLLRVCVRMYTENAPLFLAPEYVDFDATQNQLHFDDVRRNSGGRKNLLRPETLESLYYLRYFAAAFGGEAQSVELEAQKNGMQILKQMTRAGKSRFGFSSVDTVTGAKTDSMESFFVAETLKYGYLLQAPRSTLDLSTFVLSTEAHPFLRSTPDGDNPSVAPGVAADREISS
ncbi:unnamed protein product [Amoebophrya sp. A120]|nr:unnamed protein product [Amoebophrya sp. A120]|eukprot:GSA120T00017417001.1